MTFDLCRVIDLFLYLFGFLQFRVVYNVTALFGSGDILLSRMGRKVELWELIVVRGGEGSEEKRRSKGVAVAVERGERSLLSCCHTICT